MGWIQSLLIKAGLLVVTAALIVWIGWPHQELHEPDDDQPAAASVIASPEKTPGDPAERSPSPAVKATPVHSKLDRHPRAGAKIDLNQASVEELRQLPGLGEVLARRVVDRRQAHGPYRRVEELLEVKGIGPKKFQQLQPLIAVGAGAHRGEL